MDNALCLLAKIISDELWREIVQERPAHEDDKPYGPRPAATMLKPTSKRKGRSGGPRHSLSPQRTCQGLSTYCRTQYSDSGSIRSEF